MAVLIISLLVPSARQTGCRVFTRLIKTVRRVWTVSLRRERKALLKKIGREMNRD